MRVDLLHLLRNLRRSPASAAAAVLTLSLTLGAGASIFAVVDAVVLTPPPFTNPDALVTLGEKPIDDPAAAPRAVDYGTFEAWRERAGPQAAIEAFDPTNLTLTGLGTAERVSATNVTPGFLTLLGVTPARGRSFALDDAGRPVVIVSHAFWRGKLAADPVAIGRQLVLGGRPHTIVGVLPERFFFALNVCDVWRPFPVTPAQAALARYRVQGIARLAGRLPGADLAVALDDVSRTSSPPARVVATAMATATGVLRVLAAAATLAVLIAFTNFAGLLIVRSIDRRRELAVRTALGARRLDIVRQLLLEAQVLVTMGTVGGVLLAVWMTPVLGRLALQQFGGVAGRAVMVSWRVIAVVSVVASACAWICGSLPALVAARRSVVDALRGGATPPPRERNLRRVFVTAEIALAFVLLVSVTLLGRSLFRVLTLDPGFDAHAVVALNVSLPAASYTTAERVASFYTALQTAVEERLGPRTISIVDEAPLTGDRGRSVVSVRPAEAGREAVVRAAGTGYFDVMRIPIAAGRSFDRGDNASAPLRAVVSASLAARLFAFEPAIGRHLWLTARSQAAEIVGVAGDVKHRALDEATLPTVYLPASQAPSHSSVVVVRSTRPDADVIAAVREAVAQLDRDLPVYATRSMRDVVAASPGVPARRVLTAAFMGFAVLAVVLGGRGLFGLAAHDVACRRRELALRIALGANPRNILTSTLAHGASTLGAGLVVGGVLSIWAARALGTVLLATDHLDALSIGVAVAVLVVAGAGAVLPAALRAARTDPLTALRAE